MCEYNQYLKFLTLNQQNMMYNRIRRHFWTMLENFHFFSLFFRQIMRITLRKLFFSRESGSCDLTIIPWETEHPLRENARLKRPFVSLRPQKGSKPSLRTQLAHYAAFSDLAKKGLRSHIFMLDLRTGCSIWKMKIHFVSCLFTILLKKVYVFCTQSWLDTLLQRKLIT